MRFKLFPGAQPQESREIPLPPAKNDASKKMINDGLANSKVSVWNTPVHFKGTNEVNLRSCHDHQQLNTIAVKNKYCTPSH